MMRIYLLHALLLVFINCTASDTVYAREVIKHLTSKKCFGRGYSKSGLAQAEKYILSEIKKTQAHPGFGTQFTDEFSHPVNTFPSACDLVVDGKKLKVGYDFIPDPSSAGLKGKFALKQRDSVTYADDNDK